MRTIIILFMVLASYPVSSQELKELRHTRNSLFKYDFYISFSDKKVKYEDTLHYYWFKAQKIHVTQGSSSGNLLNGPYTKFYHSGQLAEMGEFENGLKVGEWKTWFESGNLQSIYNYRDGKLTGSYMLFNENGDLRESGKMKKGEKYVDEEKLGWWKRRKKIKEALNPDETKEQKKERKQKEREQKKAEREKKREEKKIERERRLSEEGGFFERIFRIKKKEKKKK